MGNFDQLAASIGQLHDAVRAAAAGSVNKMLTLRNWLIGRYIVEYEQSGSDRAAYGANLIPRLAQRLIGRRGFSERNLQLFREFYRTYPQISQLVAAELTALENNGFQIPQKPSAELITLHRKKGRALAKNGIYPDPVRLIRHFSFSHFVELMRIANLHKRRFYEIEGIQGCWSVPQLKRQIESLLYERTGLSKDKTGVVGTAHNQNVPDVIDNMFRDPYVLEFTGLPERRQYSETDLESALLDHIQSFLLELGNGFCFEARQKRITLDNEHDRIDLVFYHRLLRCHVLIDLKVRRFRHGDAGQMNFYLNYYRENMITAGDNPPVGLILCADRDETRVRYATAGMDNQLFVSKYLTQLPSEEQIREFLENDRSRTENVLREQQAEYH
ncbi:MAG: PDDEXK nuclease domain-containing protein [Candidatus Edwardsbacteria bacterium]|nr:PDDEXK nuclease domain-containing protein [Candidatus Edwardsbacteria bacterium]